MSYRGIVMDQTQLLTLSALKEDRSDRGMCSRCGACCKRVICISEKEIEAIHSHLKEHPETVKTVEEIYKGQPHRMCPFLDWRKADHKCIIYHSEIFPYICGAHQCNLTDAEKREIVVHLGSRPHRNVDLWHEFFGDPVDISEVSGKFHLMEAFDLYTLPIEIEQRPELLLEFYEKEVPEQVKLYLEILTGND